MSAAIDILLDGFERVKQAVHGAVAGLDGDRLTERIDPGSNTIAWLAWHLTRVQDDHIADVAERDQVYLSGGWKDRFGLPFGMHIGYGQNPDQVGKVSGISADDLLAYYDEVHAHTIGFLRTLTDEDLLRVVDTRWNPPVTLAARVVSVIADDLQHAGQAAFVRGSIERLR